MITRRVRLPAVVLLMVIVGACGPSDHGDSRNGRELEVNLADSGRSVILHIGERLTLSLGSSPREHWLVVNYPHDLLTRPEPSGDHITFVVLARGRGRVEAVNTFACPSAIAHGCSIPEPGSGASQSGDKPRAAPTFEVTIRVA